ncbi:hypothetical protein KQI84_15325 [bacterium]|nr:hypothetical protein [bacterium]
MAEASTRVLLDRTTIRLDGRPFFAFAARIFLTPPEKIDEAVCDLAEAGFTAVMSPPASPGNRKTVETLFDAAGNYGLLVILAAEPRMPEPAVFLAAQYKHRPELHSYYLPLREDSEKAFAEFCSERDHLRAQDLFHPIWTPRPASVPLSRWLDAVEVHSVAQTLGGPFPRRVESEGQFLLTQIVEECARQTIGRPLFCHSIPVGVPDAAREAGVYDFDPWIERLPSRSKDWHPYLTDLGNLPRRDFMPPEPDLLRLRTYEILANRVRGIVADFYEFMQGRPPLTGRDRFCELACIAQEVGALHDFFAEGQLVRAEIETGHPRLRAAMLHHGDDILIMLWRTTQGDEYWVDPNAMSRVEITIRLESHVEMMAWRMDFPAAQPIEVARDLKGAVRLYLPEVDLTALILLTRSNRRPRELADGLRDRLPHAASYRVQGAELRLQKHELIGQEMASQGRELRQPRLLEDAREAVAQAREFLDEEDYVHAWECASAANRLLRLMVNREMTETLGIRKVERDSRLDLLRRSFFTLPRFYQEAQLPIKKEPLDYT